MLLAIDTSAGTGVAVVDRDRGVLAEAKEADTRRHAEVIGILMQAVLDQSGVAVTDLSGVAVGMGPGPFTGLRVGIAAARVFALGIGRPIVPVVSHDAIAFGQVDPVVVVTDARRREVYWSAYGGTDEAGLPIREDGPGLTAPDDLALAVTNFGRYRRIDAAEVSAASIGLIAELLYLHKRPFASSEALYLRSPDVTLSAGPKRVS
ncbi:MAG TPA: tRNA (adenosine(37)-N6)-threonylcarbamoyltransferase complex dimerization subunit type 1 TsaB [Galbitalea sp.]